MLYIVPPYGGYHYRKTIAATAGNVAATWSPAAGKRGYLLCGRITLVCDATVASRKIRLYHQITSGAVNKSAVMVGSAAAASETRVLAFTGSVVAGSGTFDADAYFGINPQSWSVGSDERFYIDILNGVAGDSYSGVLEILELPN